MQSLPHARASPSVSGSTPSSLNDLFVPPSPVPDRSRKSAGLASQDAGSVRLFLAARGVVPDLVTLQRIAHKRGGVRGVVETMNMGSAETVFNRSAAVVGRVTVWHMLDVRE
uniref:Uncharacterized protein n=1 Tax=Knipowitschia caucasica TaxID=637954 RepID=A0AAV2KH86_KNICA